MDSLEMVREFHQTFGCTINDTPTMLDKKNAWLRFDLIDEELKELFDAISDCDLVAVADALTDLKYVVNGGMLAFGLPAHALTAEVHRSNMSKLGEDGKVHYREDGKVLKPSTYSPPNLLPILRAAGWSS